MSLFNNVQSKSMLIKVSAHWDISCLIPLVLLSGCTHTCAPAPDFLLMSRCTPAVAAVYVCWHYSSLKPAHDSLYHHSLKVQCGTGCWFFFFKSGQAIISISSFLSQNVHESNGSARFCPWSLLILWTSGKGLWIRLCPFPVAQIRIS